MSDEDEARIAQLQAQQQLLTQALVAALEGHWTGAPPSVEAFLYAIDPGLQGTLEIDPPYVPE